LFTTSAPNHLLPLNGNKTWLLAIVLGITMSSCGFLQQLFGDPTPVVVEKEPEEVDSTDVVVVPKDTMPVIKEKEQTPSKTGKWAKKDSYTLSLILPFHLDETELRTLLGQENITGMQNLASLEFYEGSMMAADVLERMGIRLKINVYDDYRDESKLMDILTTMPKSDVVVGPVFTKELAVAAEWGLENETFVVSPFSPSSNITRENPFFIMANSTLHTQMTALIKAVDKEKDNLNWIVVGRPEADSMLIATFEAAYPLAGNGSYRPSLKVVNSTDNIQDFLIKGKNNFIFLASIDELFVNATMRKVSLLSDQYDLEIGGLPPLLDMESLSLDYFEKLKFHYPASYWVNPLSPKRNSFKDAFKEIYNSAPTDYTMLGYDLTLYMGYLLQYGGPYLPEGFRLPAPAGDMLYRYEFAPRSIESETDFFENKNVSILRFDNYRFERIND
jgi:hypothetical protein